MSIKNVKDIINELASQVLKPELIQDNKLAFICDDLIYRVKMPSQLDLLEADKKRNAYQIMLIQEDNTMTLATLKKVLKEKQNIDIPAMEDDLKKLEEDMLKVYERLAKKHDDDKEGIELDKKDIESIKEKRQEIINEISTRIAPSIDTQSDNYYMSYLTAICTEKNVEKDNDIEWVSNWSSFDIYLNEPDSNIKFYAMGNLTRLMMSLR